MNSRLFGGILLVIGTTIGAGMLALPVATAELGFWGSMALLLGCWGVMTASALLFLEVNLWLPANTNVISMAGATLGRGGQVIVWVVYLFLLYSILSAYMAGGGDLFYYMLNKVGLSISLGASSILFTALFGVIVYFGIRVVDYFNRGLMFGKMGSLVLLILLLLPFVTGINLSSGAFKNITQYNSLLTTAVSFGCVMIIPSLRTYFDGDVKSLRTAILVGMLVPLIFYIAWDLAIMGVVPLSGHPGLAEIAGSSTSSSDLVLALSTLLNQRSINIIANFFMPICMVTSFLSVSLGLSDFLSDGFGVKKAGVMGNSVVFGATFLPPLAIVLYDSNAFLSCIKYAGVLTLILMIFLPSVMAWYGRYHKNLSQNSYQVRGGKFLLAVLMIFATLMMVGFGVRVLT